MYCGKAYGDTCNNNDECSSKKCRINHCLMQNKGPSEGEGVGLYITLMIYATLLLIILLIILLIYKYYKKRKK